MAVCFKIPSHRAGNCEGKPLAPKGGQEAMINKKFQRNMPFPNSPLGAGGCFLFV